LEHLWNSLYAELAKVLSRAQQQRQGASLDFVRRP
jgi:hypothetical protein